MFVEDFSTPETEVVADVFSLDGLIGWLEEQPSDRTYDYTDPIDCLLCRYLRASGINVDGIDSSTYNVVGEQIERPFPSVFDEVSCGSDETYGAALQRALSLAALQGKG